MTARIFGPALRVMHRTFAEQQSATWIRSGDGGSLSVNPIKVTFNAAAEVVDADGLTMSTTEPQASVLLADALALEPSRAGDETSIFRNEGRDKLVINGRSYDIESCKPNGYGTVQLRLKG